MSEAILLVVTRFRLMRVLPPIPISHQFTPTIFLPVINTRSAESHFPDKAHSQILALENGGRKADQTPKPQPQNDH